MEGLLKIGIALGGGGVRGFAHLGVLKVLEEEGIPIGVITGTSLGSIIAGMYATNPEINKVIERALNFIRSHGFKKKRIGFIREVEAEERKGGFLFKFSNSIKKGYFYGISITKKSFFSEKDFAEIINALIDDINIEDTKKAFATVSADLLTGREVIFKEGSLRMAISASCALPGIFPPVIYNSYELVDGGIVNKIPVRPAREIGADMVIAVDVSQGKEDMMPIRNGLDIVLRVGAVTRKALNELQLKEADVVIRPDTGGIHWAYFDKAEICVQKGIEAARSMIPEMRTIIRKRRFRKLLTLPLR